MPGFYDDNGKLVEVSTSMIDPARESTTPPFRSLALGFSLPSPRLPASTLSPAASWRPSPFLTTVGLVLLGALGAVGIGLLLRP